MWNSRALSLLLFHSFFLIASVSAQISNTTTAWNTLSGSPPLVIARGGFSGIFPDSSAYAYNLAIITSVPDVVLWCDVQLTKDGAGICFPDIKLDNATDISFIFQNQSTNYLVNGVPTGGYFSVDYTLKDLSNVFLTQGVYSRNSLFDGNQLPILTVDDLVTAVTPPGLWLNIQHDAFYSQHNLSTRNFVLSVSRRVIVNYISSPEVGFLRSITARFSPKITKLVFRFLGQDDTEPSTNQTYGSLLQNLTFIKSFASGILVPKGYIWPVDASLYLQPHTSLVTDAHKLGLEVYASDFINDIPFSYNYSYDPVAESLQFIDNGNFSVDGLLSDFPITPSEAIDCFAHLGSNAKQIDNTLIISKYGASGDFPACTDIAYKQAVSDGVDILDCPVQISKDGTPFCSSSINLIDSTVVAQTNFSTLATTIPEIKPTGSGIFSFSLNWDDIKSLTPSILNPFTKYSLFRNPKYKNVGSLLTLSEFLSFTKNQTSLPGVVIIVENAAYLAEKQGFGVTDLVIDALSKAGYDKPGAQKVFIQSTDSSVLIKFKENTNYQRVYKIDEAVGDAATSAVDDIKRFASSVVINKKSVFPLTDSFLVTSTNTVSKLKSSNLSVFVETFSNEFVSQAWDFYSDATTEINSYIQGSDIDGVITDFPKTANRYRKNKCLNLGKNTPIYMQPVQPGGLFGVIDKGYLPPAAAPLPSLSDSEVTEAPLPPVTKVVQASSPAPETNPGTKPKGNAQPKVIACFFLPSLAVLVTSLLLI
ncbi:PREDICTED: glycerophosphodiester phosphodiesterase GDPDL3-like [Lupinus angustifolius]|uniref:glycerophosphodiester phosphodiesterase GDPDL3-like n=1 Tax=Lupinus angustifolius TaxID=3871 RepID=UPI00092F3186|nr:PREDICTED: glycerophosphodiester phosphodiesterase GDPDL3-like [Lupinus angustifolius]